MNLAKCGESHTDSCCNVRAHTDADIEAAEVANSIKLTEQVVRRLGSSRLEDPDDYNNLIFTRRRGGRAATAWLVAIATQMPHQHWRLLPGASIPEHPWHNPHSLPSPSFHFFPFLYSPFPLLRPL